jgi:hypothetical protein
MIIGVPLFLPEIMNMVKSPADRPMEQARWPVVMAHANRQIMK